MPTRTARDGTSPGFSDRAAYLGSPNIGGSATATGIPTAATAAEPASPTVSTLAAAEGRASPAGKRRSGGKVTEAATRLHGSASDLRTTATGRGTGARRSNQAAARATGRTDAGASAPAGDELSPTSARNSIEDTGEAALAASTDDNSHVRAGNDGNISAYVSSSATED